jgi:hypothetical protein
VNYFEAMEKNKIISVRVDSSHPKWLKRATAVLRIIHNAVE